LLGGDKRYLHQYSPGSLFKLDNPYDMFLTWMMMYNLT
jgi:hypothetical protein